jgi:hypothetical protein
MIEARDLVIATCAIIGAGLGIFNLARTYLADSERLRVAVIEGDDQEYPGVEVVNVSPFPITVMQIGTVHPDGQVVDGIRMEPKYANENRLPKRIEARHSHLFRISKRETIARTVSQPRYTFVRTALGNVFTSERFLDRLLRRGKELSRLKAKDI